MFKKVLFLFVFSIFFLLSLYSLSPEVIYYSSYSSLFSMLENRGLETSGTIEEMRNRLYEYENLDYYSFELEKDENEKEEYKINIISAESFNKRDDILLLDGNVEIEFILNDSGKKKLSASSVIIENEKKKLTALGSALYSDLDPTSSIKEINGDILTVEWKEENIYITDGTTKTERRNSDNKEVTFYTSGDSLSYLNGGSIIFDDGYITSNPSYRYSSISAKRISILPGEDMFLYSATFNIGRVPILYLPFFFFPGSRILGNPSFGFSSDKGSFLNTTFEIFGSYPDVESNKESSSFASLLKSTDEKTNESLDGYYYGETSEESSIEKWAKESKSYLSILFDTYSGRNSTSLSGGGIHLGVEGNIFINDSFNIKIQDGIATPRFNDSSIRYYGINSLDYRDNGLSLSIYYPFYSDRDVLSDYLNRLVGFSISPLLGSESTFPSTFSRYNSSLSRILNFSYSLPQSYTSFYLSKLDLRNFKIENTYSITRDDKTVLTKSVLPSFNLSLSGSLLKIEEENDKKDVEERKKDEQEHEESILLPPLYKSTSSNYQNEEKTRSRLEIDYQVSNNYSKIVDYIENEEKTNRKEENNINGKVEIDSNISSFFFLNNTLSSSLYYYLNDNYIYPDKSNTKSSVSALDTLNVRLPHLGLNYNLSFSLFSYNRNESPSNIEIKENYFDFSSESVKAHSISLSKAFTVNNSKLTGEISYTLPPLSAAITPKISFSNSSFSASLKWNFVNKNNSFERELITFILSYNTSNFLFSSTFNYDSSSLSLSNLSSSHSLLLKTNDSKYSIKGDVLSDGSITNYIKSIKTSIVLNNIKNDLVFLNDGFGKIKLDSLSIKADSYSFSSQLYKGRVFLSLSLDSSVKVDFKNKKNSYLLFSPHLTFSIAEFLDFSFSFTTQNNKLYEYFEGKDFFSDLFNSLDFSSDGRNNTSFILQSASLDIVHYMEDWNLYFQFKTDFSSSPLGQHTVYTLTPKMSIYLQWNTIPELKAEENWEYDGARGEWKRK